MSPTFSTSLLVLLLSAVRSVAVTFPATVEVDLVFPRNDTYAPVALMPIVFAIQNSQYAAYLNPTISFDILSATNLSHLIGQGLLDLSSANFSSSNPYYAHSAMSVFNGLEGDWSFRWTLNTANCSTTDSQTSDPGTSQLKSITFSTRNGSQQPDLVAASANSVCTNTNQSFTFNVTGTVNETTDLGSEFSCAVLPSTTPTPSPCGGAVGSAAASSISAAITATACLANNPHVTCTSTGRNSAGRVTFPGWWLMCLALVGLNFGFLL